MTPEQKTRLENVVNWTGTWSILPDSPVKPAISAVLADHTELLAACEAVLNDPHYHALRCREIVRDAIHKAKGGQS